MHKTIQKYSFVVFTVLMASLLTRDVNGQQYESDSTRWRRHLVYGTEATLAGISIAGLNSLWYANYPRESFHFFNDNHEWLQMDKAGHFMTSYYVGAISTSALQWSGVKKNKSVLIGGTTGLIYLTGIEILDGFSSGWGFSWGDEIANIAGSSLFIGQEFLWNEQRITFKFSYSSTEFAKCNPELLGRNFQQRILKDYNGQTYWSSFNVSRFMATDAAFPKWLNIAIGYGATKMLGTKMNDCSVNNFQPTREFYLSFDADLNRVEWPRKWMKTTAKILSFIKIPAPTLEVRNDGFVKMHALFF